MTPFSVLFCVACVDAVAACDGVFCLTSELAVRDGKLS